MYLISIYFNEETERKLKNIIQHIANETGNTFMLDNQVPPHMTVAAVETKHEDVLVARMDELVKRLQNDTIQFVSTGSFASKVIYVQPVLNEYLHNLSVTLKQELDQIEETILSPYYQPFSWLPHCTMAKQLSKEQMQQAFSVLQNEFMPMDARVVRIGIAKTNPHRDMKLWELQEKEKTLKSTPITC